MAPHLELLWNTPLESSPLWSATSLYFRAYSLKEISKYSMEDFQTGLSVIWSTCQTPGKVSSVCDLGLPFQMEWLQMAGWSCLLSPPLPLRPRSRDTGTRWRWMSTCGRCWPATSRLCLATRRRLSAPCLLNTPRPRPPRGSPPHLLGEWPVGLKKRKASLNQCSRWPFIHNRLSDAYYCSYLWWKEKFKTSCNLPKVTAVE